MIRSSATKGVSVMTSTLFYEKPREFGGLLQLPPAARGLDGQTPWRTASRQDEGDHVTGFLGTYNRKHRQDA
jgi:hypothetical protein